MGRLSQAPPLAGLLPAHGTFQGHAAHLVERSPTLSPNDSGGACTPTWDYLICFQIPSSIPESRFMAHSSAWLGARAPPVMGPQGPGPPPHSAMGSRAGPGSRGAGPGDHLGLSQRALAGVSRGAPRRRITSLGLHEPYRAHLVIMTSEQRYVDPRHDVG